MKKTLILIICLFICGCNDYVELNKLSLVTAASIDKSEGKYEISLLIANSPKVDTSAKEGEAKTTVYKGKGKTISEAIKIIEKKTPKQLYFNHINVIIISEEIGKEGFLKIADWWMRNPQTRNRFYLMQVNNDKASDVLKRIPTLASDPMLMYFTSGTTGYPKGVIHNYTYPLAHIITARYWQQTENNGLHFTVAETGWAKASWGKLYGQWLTGCAVMVYDFDNFEPRQLSNVINKYGVTSFCAPPTVYRYLVRKGIPKMPSLKHATTAGEMLSPEVFRKFFEATGLTLAEGYGQTETTLLIANFKGVKATEGSIGIPSPLYNIELRTKDGRKPLPGEIGEVVIVPKKNAPRIGIFSAYLDNEKQYEHVWRDGVYHTGDAAYLNEEGNFCFHGRFDDIIKTGGFRVGPYEVENVLIEHPAVAECSVIGVPDTLRGQAIKAVVVLDRGYTPSGKLEKDIKEFCNKKLAEYKWIRLVEFVKEMPKTISGKIVKPALRG